MKIIKKRYAYVTAQLAPQCPLFETLTFIVAGTENIGLTDPRIVDVDGNDVVLTSVANALYSVPQLPTTYKNVNQLNPTTFAVEVVPVPDTPIIDASYYSSPFWDPYAIAVDTQYSLITEAIYWTMYSAYMVATHT